MNGLSRKEIAYIKPYVSLKLSRKANQFAKRTLAKIGLDFNECLLFLGLGEQKYPLELRLTAIRWVLLSETDRTELIKWSELTPTQKRKQIKMDKGIKEKEQIDKYFETLNSFVNVFNDHEFSKLSEVGEELKQLGTKYNFDNLKFKIKELIDSEYNDSEDIEGKTWIDLINLLAEATEKDIEQLENTHLGFLFELFFRLFKAPEEGKEDVFFTEMGAEIAKNLTNILNPIEAGI